MNQILKIDGFKCHKFLELNLSKLTVLAGENGGGKSSIIQSLLLLRLAYEQKNNFPSNKIPINEKYNLGLGTFIDIINRIKYAEGSNDIKLMLNNFEVKLTYPDSEFDNTSVRFSTILDGHSIVCQSNFYYLSAERIGPKILSNFQPMDFLHCGINGEYTAQVLSTIESSVNFESAFYSGSSIQFMKEFNKELQNIFPNISITSQKLWELCSQIRIKQSRANSDVLATNFGFGVTYALPIIVNGMIAISGSLFIIENPEAHLHPKAQSNIGYFIGRLILRGIIIIVETHSEHVVNGIRRALIEIGTYDENNLNIYFFTDGKDPVKINLEANGSYNSFPKDFFDQLNQDINQIILLKNQK